MCIGDARERDSATFAGVDPPFAERKAVQMSFAQVNPTDDVTGATTETKKKKIFCFASPVEFLRVVQTELSLKSI